MSVEGAEGARKLGMGRRNWKIENRPREKAEQGFTAKARRGQRRLGEKREGAADFFELGLGEAGEGLEEKEKQADPSTALPSTALRASGMTEGSGGAARILGLKRGQEVTLQLG